MATTILNANKLVTIENVVVDCTMDEQHNFSSKVTKFPIENGGSISDHIINDNITLTLHGMITNNPIDGVSPEQNNAAAAYQDLTRLYEAREAVSIVTGLKKYDNMVMTSLSIPRSKNTCNMLEFNASFEQIKIVSTQSVPFQYLAPVVAKTVATKKSVNKVTPAKVEAKPGSVLFEATNKVVKLK